MTGVDQNRQTAPLTPERLGFTSQEVQLLNEVMAACLNGVEAELRRPIPLARAKYLMEMRDTCKKWLHSTGAALPAERPSIIMPPGRA